MKFNPSKIPARYALSKQLWLAVIIKMGFIFLLWVLFFNHPMIQSLDDNAMLHHCWNFSSYSQHQQKE